MGNSPAKTEKPKLTSAITLDDSPGKGNLGDVQDNMEADMMPDLVPLMRKKTMIIENMDAQHKFADEQFTIN